MDYLCLAVWREVARSESGSREQAQEYFWERFGHGFMAKLETEKKKLEGRIRYYDRKAEKPEGNGAKRAGMGGKAVGGRMGTDSELEL